MEYVIIGNGVAGITAALSLRQRDRRAGITVISGESDYFFSRTALMYAFMDRMNLRDMEPYERRIYDAQKIRRVRGWVRNLDATAKEVTLDDGHVLRYDRLLLATGSVPNRPDWSGLDQAAEGVVHFVSLQDLAKCEELTPSTRRAVVVGGGLIGVELVECLAHHRLAVAFLVREQWYWPMALAEEEGMMIADHLRSRGVELLLSDRVAVVKTSNRRVASVVTTAGAELPCEMLGICVGVRPAVDWLASVKTPPELGRGIRVSPDFRTSLPDVWASGDCAEIVFAERAPVVEQIWYSAKRQGELAARSMQGELIRYEPPVFYNSAKFFDVEYTTVGRAPEPDETARTFYYRVPGRDVSLRIIENASGVIGFSMLGSRWNHTIFEEWIRGRRSMDAVMTQLHLAQFDVEFGRLDLRAVRRHYEEWRVSPAAAEPQAVR